MKEYTNTVVVATAGSTSPDMDADMERQVTNGSWSISADRLPYLKYKINERNGVVVRALRIVASARVVQAGGETKSEFITEDASELAYMIGHPTPVVRKQGHSRPMYINI